MVPPALSGLFPPGADSISVAEFMGAALYHPEHGYYTRNIRAVGRRGDFSTGPSISQGWGRALARWALARRSSARPWHVIEVGGGGGDLAHSFLKALGWWHRRGLRYHLVEISGPLRTAQEARLKGRNVRWHTRIEEALQEAGGDALIFSNELVDAFPCEVYVRRGGAWKQLRLRLGENEIAEVEADADPLPASSAFTGGHPEGQRVEVHAAYRDWLHAWRPLWKTGAMLTVDYGDEAADLYHRRPRGTLRAYAHHQRIESGDPALYAAPGRRDLTADVNFTDLAAWARECALDTHPLQTQSLFLEEWAPALARSQDEAVHYLLDPEGMGGAFKVLEQRPAL